MDVHENSFQPADVKPILEIDLLWMTAGLGCDGDTISITAATLPSIEEIVLGALPGIPKVNFHNQVLAYENGDEFVQIFHRAAEGRSNPYILVLEGSVPDENNKAEGYWACFGTDQATGQPITTNSWLDRLVPHAWAVVAAGTCATYGGIHAMAGNPTGAMGLPDYLGWQWKSEAGIPIVCVPGCPVQPDNFMEVLYYLLRQAAGNAPMIPLDENLRPTWLFGQTVHEGCDRAGYYEQADFTGNMARRSASSNSDAGDRSCSAMSASAAGWMASAAARESAAFASAARCPVSRINSCRLWKSRRERSCRRKPSPPMASRCGRWRFHEGLAQSGTIVCRLTTEPPPPDDTFERRESTALFSS